MAPAIQLQDVSKRYRIGLGVPSLRAMLANHLTRERNGERHNAFHWAVRDVSFEMQPGESLGIIGPNGAGKTTILKMLAHVTRPTSGEIRVNGRLSALIELGAGFHPDLTGRENIFLNGAILGMRKSEIKARFDRIVDFAAIGEYLDAPVKHYSSGMYARLGFAIAAHVEPQVLLVDEVLAVGDYAFQMKCYARMDELRSAGTSLIFVSHNFDAVRRTCEKGLVLYRGQAVYHGPAAAAIVAYSEAIRKAAREAKAQVPAENGLAERVMTFDAEIVNVQLLGEHDQPVSVVKSGQCVSVDAEVLFHKDLDRPVFSCSVRTSDGRLVYDTTTRWMKIETPNGRAGERWLVQFALRAILLEGLYELGVDVAEANFNHYYDRVERALDFRVVDDGTAQGLADMGARVGFRKLSASEG